MPLNEKPSPGGPSPSRKAQVALGSKLNRKAKEPPTLGEKPPPRNPPPARRSTGQ
jgi:hypothetical protein